MTNFKQRDEAVAKMVAIVSDRAGWENIGDLCMRNRDEKGMIEADEHVARLNEEFSKCRKIVMEHVWPLILSASSRISRNQTKVDDIASAAAIHVMEKIDQFDPERGDISTFVSRLVLDAALKHIRQDRLIVVPEKLMRSVVANETPKTKRKRIAIAKAHAAIAVGTGDVSESYISTTGKEPSAYDVLEDKESLQRLATAVSKLGKRDADVIRRRFGIDCEPQTLLEIAEDKAYGVTKERVRQIEGEAMKKLQVMMA